MYEVCLFFNGGLLHSAIAGRMNLLKLCECTSCLFVQCVTVSDVEYSSVCGGNKVCLF